MFKPESDFTYDTKVNTKVSGTQSVFDWISIELQITKRLQSSVQPLLQRLAYGTKLREQSVSLMASAGPVCVTKNLHWQTQFQNDTVVL